MTSILSLPFEVISRIRQYAHSQVSLDNWQIVTCPHCYVKFSSETTLSGERAAWQEHNQHFHPNAENGDFV